MRNQQGIILNPALSTVQKTVQYSVKMQPRAWVRWLYDVFFVPY